MIWHAFTRTRASSWRPGWFIHLDQVLRLRNPPRNYISAKYRAGGRMSNLVNTNQETCFDWYRADNSSTSIHTQFASSSNVFFSEKSEKRSCMKSSFTQRPSIGLHHPKYAYASYFLVCWEIMCFLQVIEIMWIKVTLGHWLYEYYVHWSDWLIVPTALHT